MNIEIKGNGPINSKIVIVGEAPGVSEISAGLPFVGASGKLLENCMESAGIVRSSCYVTNVFKERPPNNDITYFFEFVKGVGYTYKNGAEEHIAYLWKELEETDANIYIAVGRVPLYVLTGLDKITKRRGSIIAGIGGIKGKKVMPVIHPAAAMRNYDYTFMIKKDMFRIKQDMEFPELRLPERVLEIDPGYERALEMLETIRLAGLAGNLVAFDIEVLNKQVSCISFSHKSEYALTIPFTKHYRDYYTVDQEEQIWLKIEEILNNSLIQKVAQNCIFDCSFLLHRYGIVSKNVEDTMTAHYILFPDFPKGLDFLCSTLTREPYYKDEGKEAMGKLDIDDVFLRYNAKDSAVLQDIFPKLEMLLKSQGNWETYKRQMAILPALLYIGERGIRVNHSTLADANIKSQASIDKLQKELNEIVGGELNINSSKQMKEYFYDKLKISIYKDRSTGRPTLDDNALKRITIKDSKGSKEASIARSLRKIYKMQGSYLEAVLDENGRMSGAYKIMGTVTGRLASGLTIFRTGINMQTIPPDLKKHLIADEGCLVFEADLSQAEGIVVAWTGPEPKMKQAFMDGIDIHSLTASMLFGIPIEKVSNAKGSSSIGDGTKSERDWGKQTNHSLNYDLGYKSFAFNQEIKSSTARSLVEKWHNIYPGIRRLFHTKVISKLKESRTVTNCYGRIRKFFGRWGDSLFKEAYAQGPQSTVADKINIALAHIYADEKRLFKPLELLNQVHDSIWFQLPISIGESRIAEIVKEVRDIMEEPVPYSEESFVIPADVKMGYDFYNMISIQDNKESICAGIERIDHQKSFGKI